MRSTRRFFQLAGTLMAGALLTLGIAMITSCGGMGDPCVEAANHLADCTGKQAAPQFFEACYQNLDQAEGLAGASCEQLSQGGKADWGDWWEDAKDWWYGEEEVEPQTQMWVCFAPCHAKTSWSDWNESPYRIMAVGNVVMDQEYARYSAQEACLKHEPMGTVEVFRLNPDGNVSCVRNTTSWGCGLTCQGRTEWLEWDGGSGVLPEDELSGAVSMRQVYDFVKDNVRMISAIHNEKANLATLDAVVGYLGHRPLVQQCVNRGPQGTTVEYRVHPEKDRGCYVQ